MQLRKTFLFTCTVTSVVAVLALAAGFSGCTEEEDAAGHRETFTYEWWNADTWKVGDATYYRLTIDFQG